MNFLKLTLFSDSPIVSFRRKQKKKELKKEKEKRKKKCFFFLEFNTMQIFKQFTNYNQNQFSS